MAKAFRLYEREVLFYTSIAPHVKAAIPHCYFSTLKNDGAGFTLLLEDLSPLQVGDTHEALHYPQAVAGTRVLAQFHASFWNKQELLDSFHLMKPSDSREMMDRVCQEDVVESFLSIWECEVDDVVKHRVRTARENLSNWLVSLEDKDEPHALIHGDTKPTNMMFSSPVKNEAGEEVVERCVLLDFQSYMEGGLLACVDDLNFFLVGALEPQTFSTHHKGLIKEYTESLRLQDLELLPRKLCFQCF
eukprot:gene1761-1923_t